MRFSQISCQFWYHIFANSSYYISYVPAFIVAMEFKVRMDENYQANLVASYEDGFLHDQVEKFRARMAG